MHLIALPAIAAAVHKNKTCELCKASPINGIRYRSLVVTDREFNLCQTCFWSGAYRRRRDEDVDPWALIQRR